MPNLRTGCACQGGPGALPDGARRSPRGAGATARHAAKPKPCPNPASQTLPATTGEARTTAPSHAARSWLPHARRDGDEGGGQERKEKEGVMEDDRRRTPPHLNRYRGRHLTWRVITGRSAVESSRIAFPRNARLGTVPVVVCMCLLCCVHTCILLPHSAPLLPGRLLSG